ncbi:MAG: GDP-mannose 4,6-dehydratase [Patescibacteria group bacterium]
MKRALITGITGQDGSYLAELLVAKGYHVAGLQQSGAPLTFIEHLRENVTLYEGDITDGDLLTEIIRKEKPDELYNLASVATVSKPWEDPLHVLKITGFAPITLLEIIKKESPHTKFFQASSAEMFGDPEQSPQNENTSFHPKNPYGLGKLLAHLAVGQYREQHRLFAVSGILFNHESPRRGEGFVTRKITKTLARIRAGMEKELVVGNLDAVRDWGFAGDYVEGMWMMLNARVPDDYVLASGETHTVRDFIQTAARVLGLSVAWEGKGDTEVGKDANGGVVVRVSKEFFRPTEKVDRRGDISKIQANVGWKPKTRFEELVRIMVEADVLKA